MVISKGGLSEYSCFCWPIKWEPILGENVSITTRCKILSLSVRPKNRNAETIGIWNSLFMSFQGSSVSVLQAVSGARSGVEQREPLCIAKVEGQCGEAKPLVPSHPIFLRRRATQQTTAVHRSRVRARLKGKQSSYGVGPSSFPVLPNPF